MLRRFLPLLILFTSACKESILHDLDELKANQVKLILARQNIPAFKTRDGGGWSIKVSKSDVDRALQLIDRSRMLKRSVQRNTEDSSSFVRSREERQRWVERKLAWSLEDTLESYPGVLEARVHIHMSDSKSLAGSKPRSRASVLLVGEQSIALEKVKQLVSGASGVESVNVVLARGREVQELSAPAKETYLKELPREILVPLLAFSLGVPAFLFRKKRCTGSRVFSNV